MARIMTINDITNDIVDSSDENTLDINNDGMNNDDLIDSDDEYPNGGSPISNEDIENELFIDSFNTGIFVTIIWFTKFKKII